MLKWLHPWRIKFRCRYQPPLPLARARPRATDWSVAVDLFLDHLDRIGDLRHNVGRVVVAPRIAPDSLLALSIAHQMELRI